MCIRDRHKATRYYMDEFHLLLKEEQTAAYSVEIWKRFKMCIRDRFGSWETFPAWSFLPVSLPKAGMLGAMRSNAALLSERRKQSIAFVPVPKYLNRVKTKVMFNLTKRQLICFAIAAAVGVPIFFLAKAHLDLSKMCIRDS